MSSRWGRNVRISVFGESHGLAVGVVVEGLPSGFAPDMEELARQMARRAPSGQSWATKRSEKDEVEVLSGLFNGKLTGSPLCLMVLNTDQHSASYPEQLELPRPGHADFTAHIRYGGAEDFRGGGHFSGRLTAPIVAAGALATQVLAARGVSIGSHIRRVGEIADAAWDLAGIAPESLDKLRRSDFPTLMESSAEEMKQAIERAKAEADSVGGEIETAILGLPAGIGSPMMDGMESVLASLLFSIPAVKGVQFGLGFALARLRGSEANDSFAVSNGIVKTVTNNCGGLLGGITTGMPVVFSVALKPTPSIAKTQQTVNLTNMTEQDIAVKGRHDPCVVPRAVPVVEAAAALAVLDAWMDVGFGAKPVNQAFPSPNPLGEGLGVRIKRGQDRSERKMMDLQDIRKQIDDIDAELSALFQRRMALAAEVADYKKERGLPVLDAARERTVIERAEASAADDELRPLLRRLFEHMMAESRQLQQSRLASPLPQLEELTGGAVAYLGPEGSFSHEAARQAFGADRSSFGASSFEEVLALMASGKCRYGVLPVENSLTGGVFAAADLLAAGTVRVVGETVVAVRHCLLGLPGAVASDVRTVLSHPQPLEQCRQFLLRRGLDTRACGSTAAAAREVAQRLDVSLAAIASQAAGNLHGLVPLLRDIQDNPANFTRFLVISASEQQAEGADKISAVLVTEHKPGALYGALKAFADRGVNILNLVSRPVPGSPWKYCFYMDFDGNLSAQTVREALAEAGKCCRSLLVLGNYKKWVG